VRVLFLADQFADSHRDKFSKYPGGAEMTDQAVIEASPFPVERCAIQGADPATFADYDLLVVGNLSRATPAQRKAIARLGRHVLFEHDYRMCRFRGDFGLTRDPVHRQLHRCACRQRAWGDVFASALGIVLLTHRQLALYRGNPWLRLPPHRVLGCSVMSSAFVDFVQGCRERVRQREGTVVVYSAHRIKGYEQALAYCRRHGLTPAVIRDAAPERVWSTFCDAARLVYLPQWIEPAGRLALEARFLGCDLVSNEWLGVAGESWWAASDETAWPFVRDAAARFWRLVAELSHRHTDRLSSWRRPNLDPVPVFVRRR
jgi:hypothetical protein